MSANEKSEAKMKTRKDGEMNLPPSLVECTTCGKEIKGYLNRHKCKSQHTPKATTTGSTPGPWKAEGLGISSDDAPVLAKTMADYVSEKEALANARLIAAAPELLEALKLAQRSLTGPTQESQQKINSIITQAIAKAENSGGR